MSDQERSNEAELAELVWAHNPTTGSPVKQMTRGKLRVLQPSGYVETSAPTGEATPAAAAPTESTAPSPAPAEPQRSGRRAASGEEKS